MNSERCRRCCPRPPDRPRPRPRAAITDITHTCIPMPSFRTRRMRTLATTGGQWLALPLAIALGRRPGRGHALALVGRLELRRVPALQGTNGFKLPPLPRARVLHERRAPRRHDDATPRQQIPPRRLGALRGRNVRRGHVRPPLPGTRGRGRHLGVCALIQKGGQRPAAQLPTTSLCACVALACAHARYERVF